MAKKEVLGTCNLCGSYGKLSSEHVPPRKAFNEGRVYMGRPANGLPLGPAEMIDKRLVQNGVQLYTLCGPCNNNTGTWYAAAFVEWCRQGMEVLRLSGGKPTLIYGYRAKPLNVLKQIVTMFFSVLGPEYGKKQPDLVHFVLNREEQGLPLDLRFYIYYNLGTPHDNLRYSPPIVNMNYETGRVSFFSEITFPPFGYVMVLGNTEPPDRKMVDITYFSRFKYNQARDVEIQLPVLPTHLRLAGDYRSVTGK